MVWKDCKICGCMQDMASKRYGGQACTACATFFTRSSTKFKDYSCKNNNLCLAIPSMVGISCRRCRYQKCKDAGMSHGKHVPQSDESNNTNNNESLYGEYAVLAKKLNCLLVICTQSPILLQRHLELADQTLLQEAIKLFEADDPSQPPPPQYVESWAQLLQSNQVPLDKVYLLFYSIVCKIIIKTHTFADQFILSMHQRNAFQRDLLSNLAFYGTEEFRDGIEKLAIFYASEYQKYF